MRRKARKGNMPEQKKPADNSAAKNGEAAIKRAFWDTVKHQIGKDRQHGWGIEDSMAVIDAVVAEDAAQSEGEAKGFSLSETATELVRLVVNMSAFRQQLESKGVALLDKSEKTERKRGLLKSMATEFGGEE